MAMGKYTLNYFGSFPREALLIIQYMLERWPNVRLFCVDELSNVVGMDGRALSGSLSSFSKRSGKPLVVKAGTNDRTEDGRTYSRPKQMWALNPGLSESDIEEMRVKVNQLAGLDRPIRSSDVIGGDWKGLEFDSVKSDFNREELSTSVKLGD